MIRYVVLDCEPLGQRHGRFQLADAQVCFASTVGLKQRTVWHAPAVSSPCVALGCSAVVSTAVCYAYVHTGERAGVPKLATGSSRWSQYVIIPDEYSTLAGVRLNHSSNIQVAREADLGANDNIFLCRTHLGGFLKPGDIALGYDLARFVTSDDNLEGIITQGYQLPDVVLVKKCFDEVRAKRRAQQKPRGYKLKHLDMDRDTTNFHVKRGQAQEAQRAEDMEHFLNVSISNHCD